MTSTLTIAKELRALDREAYDGRFGAARLEREFGHRDLDYELERASWYEYKRHPRSGLVLRVPTTELGSERARHSGMGLGTYAEMIYSNAVAGTAKNTFTTEFQINDTTAMGAVATLPAQYFTPPVLTKTVRIIGGVIQLGTGSTPPTWQLIHRFNPVVTPAVPPTGPNIGGMTAGVTGTTTTSSLWRSELDVQLTLFGAAGGNSTLRGTGMVWSPTGFVSPFSAVLLGGGASPGTVATFDWSLVNTLTYGVVCGTSLLANQVQLVSLMMIGWN